MIRLPGAFMRSSEMCFNEEELHSHCSEQVDFGVIVEQVFGSLIA